MDYNYNELYRKIVMNFTLCFGGESCTLAIQLIVSSITIMYRHFLSWHNTEILSFWPPVATSVSSHIGDVFTFTKKDNVCYPVPASLQADLLNQKLFEVSLHLNS